MISWPFWDTYVYYSCRFHFLPEAFWIQVGPCSELENMLSDFTSPKSVGLAQNSLLCVWRDIRGHLDGPPHRAGLHSTATMTDMYIVLFWIKCAGTCPMFFFLILHLYFFLVVCVSKDIVMNYPVWKAMPISELVCSDFYSNSTVISLVYLGKLLNFHLNLSSVKWG
jgi:hypothetical protein